MRKLISLNSFLELKKQVIIKTIIIGRFVKKRYQQLSKLNRLWVAPSMFIFALYLIVALINHKNFTPSSVINQQEKFETTPKQSGHNNKSSVDDSNTELDNVQAEDFQLQINQLTLQTIHQYDSIKDELSKIQNNMNNLVSQDEFQQLQQSVLEPNQTILGKVNGLENSIKQVIQQTAKEIWIKPEIVEQYFRLVAIQGFSDGMRAIIDIDGNQTTLSHNEICPGCQGWILTNMDFANQSAVFEKMTQGKTLYVNLQAK